VLAPVPQAKVPIATPVDVPMSEVRPLDTTEAERDGFAIETLIVSPSTTKLLLRE
jgi:hypothetical protein